MAIFHGLDEHTAKRLAERLEKWRVAMTTLDAKWIANEEEKRCIREEQTALEECIKAAEKLLGCSGYE